jgi:hypothetical protein
MTLLTISEATALLRVSQSQVRMLGYEEYEEGDL